MASGIMIDRREEVGVVN